MAARRLHRAALWAAAGMAGVVLVFTGYAAFSGGDSEEENSSAGPQGGGSQPSASASPGPEYTAPEEWTEPEKWTALPRGQREDIRGRELGFPHTTEGAVAVLVAANTTEVEGERTAVDEHLANFAAYYPADEQTGLNRDKIELAALQTDRSLRREMGVDADAESLPSGAYARSTPVGYKIVSESDDEVVAWILSRATVKGGETEREEGAYSRTLMAVRWEDGDGDWKVALDATADAVRSRPAEPKIAAPGDEAFNEAGWVGIRSAS